MGMMKEEVEVRVMVLVVLDDRGERGERDWRNRKEEMVA